MKKLCHQTTLEMVGPASPPHDRGSISPTTATNTFAATARDDPAGLIGMGKTTMASSCLVDEVYTLGASGTGASRRTTKVAWGGVPGGTGTLPPYRNGGCDGTLRGTAALIGMGVMPWNPGGRCAFV